MTRPFLTVLAAALFATAPAWPSYAQTPLSDHPFVSNLFSDNMVLQRDRVDHVWGWTDPGATVTVALSGTAYTATAGADGSWSVALPAHSAGGDYTLDITGPQSLHFTNVTFGDVWICSGQSNMEFGITLARNADKEIAAVNDPGIRLFLTPRADAAEPQSNLAGTWKVCTPGNVVVGGWGGFSAVAYFFGRDLRRDIHVPVGLIETSWGGTPAELWTTAEELKTLPEYADVDQQVAAARRANTGPKTAPVDISVATDAWADANDALSKLSPNPSAVGFDDSAWKLMLLPIDWMHSDLHEYEGFAWFRRTFYLPAADAGKDLTLHLGPIDDRDTTYVNGVRVGGGAIWNQPRVYTVPASVLHAGENRIAVRVANLVGNGGIDGTPDQMYLETGNSPVHLDGLWRYAPSSHMSDVPPAPEPVTTTGDQTAPSMLYNAMIAPITPFAITGAIWYQGESNVGRDEQYSRLLPAMIRGWRTHWGQGDFPFLIVQIANYLSPNPRPDQTNPFGDSAQEEHDNQADLRGAQAYAARTVPNAALALAIDIGEAGDIHPKNKQEVGRRLELAALSTAYHKKIESSGPVFAGQTIEGRQIRVTFGHLTGGLVAKGGAEVRGFAIAGSDKKFVWAHALIDGNSVVVAAPGIAQPMYVRYAWSANPVCNLYNGAGLPAVPFRTDAPW